MGLAKQSLKDTLDYSLKSRPVILLTVLLSFLSLIGLLVKDYWFLYLLYLIIRLIATFFTGYLVLCLFKKPDLSNASRVLRKFIARLVLLDLLFIGAIVILFGIAMIFISLFGSGIVLSLFGVAFLIVFIYVSGRLSLTSPIIVLKDVGVIDSLKKSWLMAEGKVLSIVAASIMLSLVYLISLIPVIILTLVSGDFISDDSLLNLSIVILSILKAFLEHLYMLSSYVLGVMLFKNISKKNTRKIKVGS